MTECPLSLATLSCAFLDTNLNVKSEYAFNFYQRLLVKKLLAFAFEKKLTRFYILAILQNHMRIFKCKYIFWKMVVYSSREIRSDTAIARRMAPTAKLCDEPFRSYEPFKIIFDLFSGIFSRVFSGYAQLWTAITHIYLIPGTRSHTFSESSLNAELKYVIIFSIECIV